MLRSIPFYASLLGKNLDKKVASTPHVLLYGAIEVHSFGSKGCIASNKTLALETGVAENQIRRYLAEMKSAGWIDYELNAKNVRKEITPLLTIEVPSRLPTNQQSVAEQPASRLPTNHIDNILDNILDMAPPTESATVEKKEETKPKFSSEEWLKSLSESPQPHIRLIAYYFGVYSEHNFPTKKVADDEMMKNMKSAVYLVKNYEKAEISRTLKYCSEKFSDVHWNLSTVKSQISYVTAKKG